MMILTLLLTWIGSVQAEVQDPCLTTEHWTLSQKSPNWLKEYHQFSEHRTSAILGFAQAVQLKRISQVMGDSLLESDFSEYWLARVLYELNLAPLSHRAFQSVFENTENADLKKASFACMARIQSKMPDWRAPEISQAALLPWTEGDSEILTMILMGKDSRLTKKLDTGNKALVEGISELKAKRYTDAIVHLQVYFKYLETHPGALIARHQDQAHLLLGRAFYSVAKFKEAAEEFQRVKKTSNEQIEALSNLAWAYLLNEKYDDAIGISLQIRSGNLKNTFAPEPMMVAAMALNEICIYPESIRMIQAFVKDYGPVFDWLSKNQNRDDGYKLATLAVKKQSEAPLKLATEWIRAPEFLSRQTEINELINQPKRMTEIELKASDEQGRQTREFLERANTFIKEVKIARLKLKANQELSSEFADRYALLKKDLRKLSQFYRAAKTWKTLSRNYQKNLPQLRANLVTQVNLDLKKKNKKMLGLLQNVRDNADLIEVEIYNGASQDMIWKNAHPEFEQAAAEMEDEKQGPESAKTWSWGHFNSADVENTEVWEDELGALKADVHNECNMKDRYLKLNLMKR